MSSAIRQAIVRQFNVIYQEQRNVPPPSFTDDLILQESGVDSMGFAILITRLEEDLGFDPFSDADQPFYPRTLGELITYYENHRR
jgi:acyl carrier protein